MVSIFQRLKIWWKDTSGFNTKQTRISRIIKDTCMRDWEGENTFQLRILMIQKALRFWVCVLDTNFDRWWYAFENGIRQKKRPRPYFYWHVLSCFSCFRFYKKFVQEGQSSHTLHAHCKYICLNLVTAPKRLKDGLQEVVKWLLQMGWAHS